MDAYEHQVLKGGTQNDAGDEVPAFYEWATIQPGMLTLVRACVSHSHVFALTSPASLLSGAEEAHGSISSVPRRRDGDAGTQPQTLTTAATGTHQPI